MEESGHAAPSSGPTGETRILKTFLASYSLSNRLFPQTRFYFVIDFSSRLDLSSLDRVLRGGAVLPPGAAAALERMANAHHGDRRSPGHRRHGRADGKMLSTEGRKNGTSHRSGPSCSGISLRLLG